MKKAKSFIDIGCGEGYVLNEFQKKGHNVTGVDFSKFGIEKFHPHLMDVFEQGNIYKKLEEKIRKGQKYNIILFANVIEHVVDPIGLLQNIKKIMLPDSLLIIVAPNDFSPLHEHLLSNQFISKKFWLCYPGHLSYFNKESMTNLLSDTGFNLKSVVADNPIDLNLLNDNSNYIEDPLKGEKTHYFRVRTDNFLAGLDANKLLQIYEILGSMGVGRDLNYYCCLAK
jgi:SAM-dependent methyltransferase